MFHAELVRHRVRYVVSRRVSIERQHELAVHLDAEGLQCGEFQFHIEQASRTARRNVEEAVHLERAQRIEGQLGIHLDLHAVGRDDNEEITTQGERKRGEIARGRDNEVILTRSIDALCRHGEIAGGQRRQRGCGLGDGDLGRPIITRFPGDKLRHVISDNLAGRVDDEQELGVEIQPG